MQFLSSRASARTSSTDDIMVLTSVAQGSVVNSTADADGAPLTHFSVLTAQLDMIALMLFLCMIGICCIVCLLVKLLVAILEASRRWHAIAPIFRAHSLRHLALE